ncbi:pectate lyase-like adhesive domain-containing protein, partial [Limosilactobacillus reuteri]|uniref:pectate lyase-like adhesive domain-containing protein n=1 Tax=Limosilactobacillus reuteri TaxID=1598 RepID=UPI003D045841
MNSNKPLTDGRLKKHYKMYKAGKLWLYSSLLVLAMGAIMINGKPVHAATENTGQQTTDANSQTISLMSRQVALRVNSQSSTSQNANLASGGGTTGSQAASSQNSNMTSGNSQSSASSQVNAVQTVNISADTNQQNDDQTSSKLSVDQLESAMTPTAALAASEQTATGNSSTATGTTSTSTDTTTEKSIDVDSWDALNNAIYKGDYTVINIINDIDAGSSKNWGDRISAGSVADRDFTINGNGHSINFADNSYQFKTSGSTNRTITLKDLTFYSTDSPTSLNPIACYGVFTYDNDQTITDSNIHHTLVFDNVNYHGVRLTSSSNGRVIFQGTNQIQIEDSYTYGGETYSSNTITFGGLPAVTAGQVIVDSGTTTITDPGDTVIYTKKTSNDTAADGSLTVNNGATLDVTGSVLTDGTQHHGSWYDPGIIADIYAQGTLKIDGGKVVIHMSPKTKYLEAGFASDMGNSTADALDITNSGSLDIENEGETSANSNIAVSAGLYVSGNQPVNVTNGGQLTVNMHKTSTTASAIGLHDGEFNVQGTGSTVTVNNYNNDSAIHLQDTSSSSFGEINIQDGGTVTINQHNKTTDGAIGISKNGKVLVNAGGKLTVNNSIDSSNDSSYTNDASIVVGGTGQLQINSGQVTLKQDGTVDAISMTSGGNILVDNANSSSSDSNLTISNTSDTASGNVITLGDKAVLSFGHGANADISYSGQGKVNLVQATNANLNFADVNKVKLTIDSGAATGSQLLSLSGSSNSLNAYNVKVNDGLNAVASPIYQRLHLQNNSANTALIVDSDETSAWGTKNTLDDGSYATNYVAPQLTAITNAGDSRNLIFTANDEENAQPKITTTPLDDRTATVKVKVQPYARVTLKDQDGNVIASEKYDENGTGVVSFDNLKLTPNTVLVAVAEYQGVQQVATKYVANSQATKDVTAISSAASTASTAAQTASSAASTASAAATATDNSASLASEFVQQHPSSLNSLENQIAQQAESDANKQTGVASAAVTTTGSQSSLLTSQASTAASDQTTVNSAGNAAASAASSAYTSAADTDYENEINGTYSSATVPASSAADNALTAASTAIAGITSMAASLADHTRTVSSATKAAQSAAAQAASDAQIASEASSAMQTSDASSAASDAAKAAQSASETAKTASNTNSAAQSVAQSELTDSAVNSIKGTLQSAAAVASAAQSLASSAAQAASSQAHNASSAAGVVDSYTSAGATMASQGSLASAASAASAAANANSTAVADDSSAR